MHCTEIVQTVCQRQCLWISQLFVQFFHTTVNVSQYRINLANSFTFQFHTEVQYSVSRWVLWTDIDYVIFWFKDFATFSMIVHTILIVHQTRSFVCQRFVGHTCWIELFRFIILTHRIAHPVFAQEDATHIGIADELYAVEVEYFTFVDICDLIPSAHTGQHRVYSVCRLYFIALAFTCFRIFQVIDDTESLFSPIHTGQTLQEGKSCLIVCFNSLAEILPGQFHQIQRIFSRNRGSRGCRFGYSGLCHFGCHCFWSLWCFNFYFRLNGCIFFYIFHSLSLLLFV